MSRISRNSNSFVLSGAPYALGSTIFPRLWRILCAFRPDIIHTNSEMAMSYAWPLARPMGIKIVNGTIRNAFSGHGLRWRWHE